METMTTPVHAKPAIPMQPRHSARELYNPLTGEVIEFSSPDSLVENWLSLDDQIKTLSNLKRLVDEGIIMLTERQADSKTARFACRAGTLKVQFRDIVKYDQEKLAEANELVGADKFGGLFKTEFKPQARPLGKFLGTTHTDPTMEAARLLIKEAQVVNPSKPSISKDN